MVEDGSIELIRYTGIPLRLFNRIGNLVDYNQKFISEVRNPLDRRWMEFLFDILYEIDDFNNSIPPDITREKIFDALDVWIKGGWYHDVAKTLNSTVDDALIFMRFLEYGLQNTAGSIIKYIEVKRRDGEENTSDFILNWPNYVVYGVDSKLKLDLTEISIPDRVLVQQIANWFMQKQINYYDLNNLRTLISEYQLDISKYLEGKVPIMSLELYEKYVRQ
jgi:hypothetical protein